ncbi:MAG: DUF3159 domain-containing protein [Acidimicrobiia bacterium]|nr:DUF3159 domain-containing protein [Acidimicrobiia bacterium]
MSSRSSTRELIDELKSVVGRSGVADGVVSPIVFVAVNAFLGVQVAAVVAVGVAFAIVGWRVARGKPLRFALSGLVGTGLAIFLALRSGEARDYFLPGLISGTATTALALASVLVGKPLTAYTSWVTRGWPLNWYWHPQVRPAYSITTWIWVLFFGVRTAVQSWLFAAEQTTALGIVRAVTGWPGLLGLLIVTYLVGRARLVSLEGPSVEEFGTGAPPPWTGQQRGF